MTRYGTPINAHLPSVIRDALAPFVGHAASYPYPVQNCAAVPLIVPITATVSESMKARLLALMERLRDGYVPINVYDDLLAVLGDES